MTPRNALAAGLLVAVLAGCGDDDPTSSVTPGSLKWKEQPAATELPVGSQIRLSVLLEGSNGKPLAGQTVKWEAGEESGTVSVQSAKTGADGVASVEWTLGTRAGRQSVRAVADGVLPLVLTVDAVAGEPATLRLSRDSVTFRVRGDSVAIEVDVADAYGNKVEGAAVTWASSAADIAAVSETGVIRAAKNGEALVVATLGSLADTVVVRVEVPPAWVEVLDVPDALAAGDTVGLRAEVRDAQGNVIEGATVTWSVSDPAVAELVDQTGRITGRKAGSTLVRATAGAATGVARIEVVAGAPVSLQKLAGDGQTGLAGERLSQAIAVKVLDAFGNHVPGAWVVFAAGEGHGSVAADSVQTNGEGIASVAWTLGKVEGENTLRAWLSGRPDAPLVFTAEATPNGRIAGSVLLQAGAAATATAGRALERPRRAASVDGQRPAKAAGAFGAASVAYGGRAARSQARSRPARVQTPDGRVHLLVRFKEAAIGAPLAGSSAYRARATAQAVASSIRGRLQTHTAGRSDIRVGVSPAVLTARLVVNAGEAEALRQRLLADPAVASVEYDGWVEAHVLPTPIEANDPLYPIQSWHYAMIDLPRAWAITTGSPSVLVAVVDDGVRFDHPDLAPNLTSDGYDFVSQQFYDVCGVMMDNAGDGDGYDPDPTSPMEWDCATGQPTTVGGHGTHVAGTIGAVGNDGRGVTGVNWSVRIRPVRVLGVSGYGTYYDVAQGILYAAGLPADDGNGSVVQASEGAQVINVSLGGPADIGVLRDAVAAATAAGALIIASAGNDASSLPSYPAAYEEVLAVAAVGPDRNLAYYSNFGPWVDVAAPGGNFLLGDASFGVLSTMWNYRDGQPTYAWAQGTSMAAPHVSGVAALLLAAQPGLTAQQLRDRILRYAAGGRSLDRRQEYGAGIVNARNSLTASLAPRRDLYAVLYNATTGAVRELTRASAGTFSFERLPVGRYLVFAGQDEEGDGRVGIPGRLWGGHGHSYTRPTPIEVSGAGLYEAPVRATLPREAEPNDTPDDANELVLYGYAYGSLETYGAADWYRVRLPAGTYTFEVRGWEGACGFAYELDPILTLLGEDGATLASNDDIDFAAYQYCSRITRALPAGTYSLRVTGWGIGDYVISVRPVE